MPIDGREPHRISRDDAGRLIARFRSERAGRDGRGGIIAHALSRGVIDEILAQPGCLGLRIYHAVNDRGVDTVVVVGITADETDITDGIIAQEARPCPPNCDDTSPWT